MSPAARVEILDRLLEENHRRAAAEARAASEAAEGAARVEEASDARRRTLFA